MNPLQYLTSLMLIMSVYKFYNTYSFRRGYSKLVKSVRELSLLQSNSPAASDGLSSTISNEFLGLGLMNEIVVGLSSQGISSPTPVQRTVIPRLLNRENLVFAASTGSGKTLAYVLPAIQTLTAHELAGYKRQIKRPRCLILVPTRELAQQVYIGL